MAYIGITIGPQRRFTDQVIPLCSLLIWGKGFCTLITELQALCWFHGHCQLVVNGLDRRIFQAWLRTKPSLTQGRSWMYKQYPQLKKLKIDFFSNTSFACVVWNAQDQSKLVPLAPAIRSPSNSRFNFKNTASKSRRAADVVAGRGSQPTGTGLVSLGTQA